MITNATITKMQRAADGAAPADGLEVRCRLQRPSYTTPTGQQKPADASAEVLVGAEHLGQTAAPAVGDRLSIDGDNGRAHQVRVLAIEAIEHGLHWAYVVEA